MNCSMRLRLRVLAFGILLAAGCATANVPPPKPLTEGDLKSLAGRWTGFFQSAFGRPPHVFILREDATFEETGDPTVGVRSVVRVRFGTGDCCSLGRIPKV